MGVEIYSLIIMRLIADIETLAEDFTVTFLDYDSDNYWQFVINDTFNHINEIKKILSKTQYLIGFNSIDFDSIILNYIIQNSPSVKKIYEISQIIIHKNDGINQHYEAFKPYSKYKYNTDWINIDLFLYWSKMLRMSKKLSLKYFAVNLDMDIQEMPIAHYKKDLTKEELKQVLIYNLNDCFVTKALAKKLGQQINLRSAIQKDTGLDVISFDAPKIASELLLDSFCKKTYNNDKPYWEYKKEIRNKQFEFKDFKNGDYIPLINFKTPIFQSLYNEIYESKNGFSKDILFKRFDSTYIKISYGSGGIHSVNKGENYHSNNFQSIWTSDVKSLYPTLLINYHFIRKDLSDVLDIYTSTREQRIQAKKEKNKIKDETLKLILNSTTGLMDNEYSWLYSPAEIMALRLTGQLILTRLLEECNLANFLVISNNTDGQEVIITKEREQEYLDIISLIEQEFNIEFEHDIYKSIWYKTVNDYLALSESNKIKVKGEFIYEKVLDGSNEFLIIPIAVKEYLVNQIPVKDTILNHTNIYDFCCSKKINKDYKIFHNGQRQQQLNRFYLSKKGAYLYKVKDSKGKTENIFKDSAVIIINNKIDEFPTDVNYDYYINKAIETIQIFEKPQLNLF